MSWFGKLQYTRDYQKQTSPTSSVRKIIQFKGSYIQKSGNHFLIVIGDHFWSSLWSCSQTLHSARISLLVLLEYSTETDLHWVGFGLGPTPPKHTVPSSYPRWLLCSTGEMGWNVRIYPLSKVVLHCVYVRALVSSNSARSLCLSAPSLWAMNIGTNDRDHPNSSPAHSPSSQQRSPLSSYHQQVCYFTVHIEVTLRSWLSWHHPY